MNYSLSRGERFVEARKVYNRHGKQTQDAVYKATGVPASKIKDLEDDDKERGVDYREIAKLARHYGVSADFLLGLSDDPRVEATQAAAASYLGLSDFETRALARQFGGSHLKRELFIKMVRRRILDGILRAIESAYYSINKKDSDLTDANADETAYEVRHIQRDLGEDIAYLLSPVTGRDDIEYRIKTIKQQKQQEIDYENYMYYAEQFEFLREEAADGEHTAD